MIRSHKIRLNPTPEQAQYFRQAAGVARFAYNWALGQWKNAYALGESVSANRLKKQFNAIKREAFPWVLDVTKCAPEQAFADLGMAFASFFGAIKKGKNIGFPRFKSKKRTTPSFYLANDKFAVDGYWIRIPKLGQVNMTEALRFNGKILSARVTERAGWWFVSIVVELPDVLHERDDSVVGVDVGITTLATLSDGTVFENQKHLAQALKRVRGLSRSFSRKTKGSRNQAKAAHKLARAHYQVACRRADSQHKATTHIARTYTYVGIEDLNVAGMVKNRKLARALSDAALGQFLWFLTYKVPAQSGTIREVGRFFASSRLCNGCGAKNESLTLADRVWTCRACGAVVDRDGNASRNIRDELVRLVATH